MKLNIKILFSSPALAFIFLLGGCSKTDNPTPDPDPVSNSKPDTLATGWKKIIVDPSINFTDIFFNSNSNGYLASKKLYRSVDGGLTWNVAANKEVINLSVTNDGKVFLINEIDSIFRSTDGGATLTSFKIPGAAGFDAFFVDNNNGYYITFSGLYITTDGGVSWTKLDTPDIYFPSSYSSLFFTSTSTGLILTAEGIYRQNGSILKWKKVAFAGPIRSWSFESIFITPDNTVYITTRYREVYKSTDGGLTFNLIKVFPITSDSFCDVHFVDNNTGYVCAGNRIYKTTDAGSTWNTVVALGDAILVELHFTDANHGWACGSKGTVLVFNL